MAVSSFINGRFVITDGGDFNPNTPVDLSQIRYCSPGRRLSVRYVPIRPTEVSVNGYSVLLDMSGPM